jgi:uncharacterized membrane protein
MARTAGAAWKVLALLGIVAHQLLVHVAFASASNDPLRIALLVAPMGVIAGVILWRASRRILWGFVLAAIALVTFLAHGAGLGVAALYGVPHAAAYVFLLWLFGRTLLGGRDALITRLARHVHGALPPFMEAYTRRLTFAWCVFFAAQLAVSALLLAFAPLETWSLFVNVLNLPLVALMFTGDYLYRVLRYPGTRQSSIATAVQAYARERLSSPRAR